MNAMILALVEHQALSLFIAKQNAPAPNGQTLMFPGVLEETSRLDIYLPIVKLINPTYPSPRPQLNPIAHKAAFALALATVM
jgi:hypothetical protein